MGWFDEQIRARKQKDQELFEDSMINMAASVLGTYGADALRDERIITKAAIDEILKYYHYKSVEIPASLTTAKEQLEYALRPHGLMYRGIILSEGWYRNSFGPLLAYRAEDGMPVVLLPKTFGGYTWRDKEGRKVTANRKTAAALLPDAICFYNPLPQTRLRIPDLFQYMKSCLNWSDYGVVVLLTILVTSAGMMLPLLTKLLTGFVLELGSEVVLWSTAIFLFSVLVVSQLFSASRGLAMSRLQIKVALPLESAMMMRLLRLPAPFFRKYSAGDLASRSSAINRLSALLIGGLLSAGMTASVSLLYLGQVLLYAPALFWPVLVIVAWMVIVTLLTGFQKMKLQRALMEAEAAESGFTYAILSGIQKIKLSGAEKRAFARWAKLYAEGASMQFNPPLLIKLHAALVLAVSLLGTLWLYEEAAVARIAPADYLAFASAYGALTGAFTAFANLATQSAQIKPILDMAEPILTTEPEPSEGKEPLTRLSGGIELSNVYFRYNENGPNILNGVNLRVKPGEYLAIVGKTGCGKSTLMRMLLGFETPDKGAVYFDGRDLRSLDLQALRRRMGVVIQDGSLFSGDIFSNITVSAPQLTLEEAWEAAELAGIADDIRAMPMGMNTFVSEGQGGISGGQRQRLMIARAIAPKPKILLFDEATSALDNKTQKQVADALAGLHCTRIVIAHRLSTVRACDRIVVLDQGVIAEQGTYEQLIQKGGIFAELVERQRVDV